jgi:hypothetical protein
MYLGTARRTAMSKPAPLIVACLLLAFLALAFGSPFWAFSVGAGFAGGLAELAAAAIGGTIGMLATIAATLLAIGIIVVLALTAGPVVIIAVIGALLVAAVVTIVALLLGALPLVVPVLLIAGLVWLGTRPRPAPPSRQLTHSASR